MVTRSMSELVVWQPPISIGLQWRYRDLKRRVLHERMKYQKLRRQILDISNLYYLEFEELRNTVKRLRQEIRLVTRGTPLTVEQSTASDNAYYLSGTEQLWNTNQMLLKDAYRKLAKLTHPDKFPERRHLFDAINVAYDLQDLGYMIELYMSLTQEADMWWRQTEGIAYQLQELERPSVSLKMLRSSPEFGIMQAHVMRKPDVAKRRAEDRLRVLAVTLNNELMYILNPKEYLNGNRTNEDQEGRESPGEAQHEGDQSSRSTDEDRAVESSREDDQRS